MTTPLDPHYGEASEGTPMSAQMSADLDKIKTGPNGTANLQALSDALDSVAQALADAINYENKVRSKLSVNKDALAKSMSELPLTKPNNVGDLVKTTTTVLSQSTASDTASIYGALELIDSMVEPNALIDFVDKMGNHINARSLARVQAIGVALDNVNGLRALLDTKI